MVNTHRTMRQNGTEPVMDDSARRHNRSGWLAQYGVAILSSILASVFVVVSLLAEDGSAAAGGAVVMGAYAVLAFIGGRIDRFHVLRGVFDEREHMLDHRASTVSYLVVGLILMALFIRDLLANEVGGLPMWLLTISGLTYTATLMYYRWRG